MRFLRIALSLILSMVPVSMASAARLYVSKAVISSGDGLSWATAKTSISEALSAAAAGDEVWVSAGRFYDAFSVPSGVRILGGFAGTETALDQRRDPLRVTIIDGSTARDGSPAFHVVTMVGTADCALDGVTIVGGSANGYDPNTKGGGVLIQNSTGTNIVSKCTIRFNDAEVDGGGIYCDQGNLLLQECTISDNRPCGISVNESVTTIADCTFSGNGLDKSGFDYALGAFFSTVTVLRSTFMDNDVFYALYFNNTRFTTDECRIEGGGIRTDRCNGSSITNCLITKSYTGIYSESSITISDCELTENNTGIYARRTPYTVRRCKVYNNGLGIEVRTGGRIENCLIFSNSTHGILSRARTKIVNCTIANNRGTTSGIYNEGDGLHLANNIFSGNSTAIESVNPPAAGDYIKNCLFYGHSTLFKNKELILTTPSALNGQYPGAVDNLAGDPRFVDAADGNFHLLSESAAIDAADPATSMTTDFDGNARPFDIEDQGKEGEDAFDIGAYEFIPRTLASDVWLMFQ